MTVRQGVSTLILCCALASASWAEPAKRIGMALWDGCEDVCEGVRDYLTSKDPNIVFLPFDAGRSTEALAGMPEQIGNSNLDLLLTWGTRVTREMVGTRTEYGTGSKMGDLPVVFTVVSDPIASDIIGSYEATGREQITGTRNRVPEFVNINGLRQVMPSFEHLGLIYEPLAVNSAQKFTELQLLSEQEGFQLTATPMQGDEAQKLKQMAVAIVKMKSKGVQFIYLGSSTFLEAHADVFTQTAVEHGLPVLSPYENLVHESQAYLSIAARDYDVGTLAAQQALRVLQSDATAGSYPVLAMQEFAFVLNGKVAQLLELFPPLDVMQFVEVTGDQQ